MSTVRGIKNSNPLNIRHSNTNWNGKAAVQADADFVTFESPHYGIRAAAKNLITYYRKYKLRTIQGIVSRWAPPEDDNDTGSYISAVAKSLNVAPDTELDLEDPEVLKALLMAMMVQEIGSIPYDAETINTAVGAAYTNAKISVVPGGKAPAQPAPQQPNAYGETPVPPLVDQPANTPSRKVQAAPLGGLAGMPVAWIIATLWNKYLPETPMDAITAIAIAASISSAGAFIAAYMTRNRATVVPPQLPQ